MDKKLFRLTEASDIQPKTSDEIWISAAALVAGYGMRKILELAYEEVYDEKAPYHIDNREIDWKKVMGWTIVSGIAVTAMKMLVRRGFGKKS